MKISSLNYQSNLMKRNTCTIRVEYKYYILSATRAWPVAECGTFMSTIFRSSVQEFSVLYTAIDFTAPILDIIPYETAVV